MNLHQIPTAYPDVTFTTNIKEAANVLGYTPADYLFRCECPRCPIRHFYKIHRQAHLNNTHRTTATRYYCQLCHTGNHPVPPR
jgi:hypothetical protein